MKIRNLPGSLVALALVTTVWSSPITPAPGTNATPRLSPTRFSSTNFAKSAAAKVDFEANGFTMVREFLPTEIAEKLEEWATQVQSTPECLHHHETTESGDVALARSEDFLHRHAALKRLITGPVAELVGDMAGEEMRIYKEKINWKAPGASGSRPHQDALTYPEDDFHVTCLVAIDDMTEENGCLEFGMQPGCLRRRFTEVLPTVNNRGIIEPDAADDLQWTPATMKRGDVLVFDSHAAHRSGPNMSGVSRKALYLTFGRAAKGHRSDALHRRTDYERS